MAKRKPGFIYLYSGILKQEIAFSKKNGTVYCEDGVKYSLAELAALYGNGGTLPLPVHIVKTVFKDSEVIEYAGNEPNAAGTTGTDGAGKSQNNAGCPAGKMAGASGNGAENESPAFEIY
jgi:hypothetical protein